MGSVGFLVYNKLLIYRENKAWIISQATTKNDLQFAEDIPVADAKLLAKRALMGFVA